MSGAGKLDRRIQFERATMADNGLTSEEVFESLGDPVWASKTDLSDGERWRAGEVGAVVTTRFRVRWSSFTNGITAKDRLVCEGATYEITGIKEVEGRRQYLEMTASRRA